jgi:hypothetical protein
MTLGEFPKPDTTAAVEFMRTWPTERMHLWCKVTDPITGEEGRNYGRTYPRTDDGYARMRADIDEAQGRANIYYLVNDLRDDVTDVDKPSNAQMKRAIAFHVDVDAKGETTLEEVAERFKNYTMQPSRLVFSGGGYQALWILRDPIDVSGDPEKAELVASYNRRLTNDLKGDPCVAVSWVLRLPGTLNLPNKKKRNDYGRVPAVARLVEVGAHDYPVSIFRQAEPEQRALVPAVGKLPPVTINWEAAENLKNTFSIDALRVRGVEAGALDLLQHGDVENKHAGDHSRIALHIAGALFRAGLSPEESAAVLGTKSFEGNAHFNKMPKSTDRKRAIKRAINASREESLAKQQRAAATAAGMPVWKGTYDKAELHPRPTVQNVEIALNAIGLDVRLDLFRNRVVMGYRDAEHLLQESVGEYLTDRAETAVCKHLINKFDFDPGDVLLHRTILQMANEHAFDPVVDYLAECEAKWDGVERLKRAAVDYFQTEDTPLNCAIIGATLVGAVRRARQPGSKFDTITVLESAEGFNKSGAIELLHGQQFFSDQTILGKSDQQAQELLAGVWGFECADLSGIRKADVENVKAFASRTEDRARPAYGRSVEWRKRRCVLWASTNDDDYLASQTGNRRFWPLQVLRPIELEKLACDRDQLWAEAAVRETQTRGNINIHEYFWAEAAVEQDERRIHDPWEDRLEPIPPSVIVDEGKPEQRTIQVLYQNDDGETRVAAGTLLTYVLCIAVERQNSSTGKRLAVVMKKLGWQRHKTRKVFIEGHSVSGFFAAGMASLASGEAYEAYMAHRAALRRDAGVLEPGN